jgi:hypothetical protein
MTAANRRFTSPAMMRILRFAVHTMKANAMNEPKYMGQWFAYMAGMKKANCPARSAATSPRESTGCHTATPMAKVVRTSGHVPDQLKSPASLTTPSGPTPLIRPASATHHREKNTTAAAGAPQCRPNFRTGSMPATLSAAIGAPAGNRGISSQQPEKLHLEARRRGLKRP